MVKRIFLTPLSRKTPMTKVEVSLNPILVKLPSIPTSLVVMVTAATRTRV